MNDEISLLAYLGTTLILFVVRWGKAVMLWHIMPWTKWLQMICTSKTLELFPN